MNIHDLVTTLQKMRPDQRQRALEIADGTVKPNEFFKAKIQGLIDEKRRAHEEQKKSLKPGQDLAPLDEKKLKMEAWLQRRDLLEAYVTGSAPPKEEQAEPAPANIGPTPSEITASARAEPVSGVKDEPKRGIFGSKKDPT